MAKIKEKEFTVKDSINIVKNMFKDKSRQKKLSSLVPGDLFFGVYDAKNKEAVFDKRPFVIILRKSKSYILGANFNWAPLPLRVVLVKKILQMNTKNIKNNKPLEFSYKDLKPFMKKIGFAPIIRLYITKRMSNNVVQVPPEHLMTAARLQTAVFTNGKKAEELYKRAIAGNKSYRSGRRRVGTKYQ